MKRLIVVTLLVAVVFGAMLYFMPQSIYSEILCYADDAKVTVYCRSTLCSAVNTGLGYMVNCTVANCYETLRNCRDVDGLSVCFDGNEQDAEFVISRLNAQIISVQQLDGLYVACLYSPRLRGGIVIDGKLVNVQIALSGGTVTVGYPLILGEY